MIIKTFYSKGSLNNRVEVTLFEAADENGIVKAHGFATFLSDDALATIEAMTDDQVRTFVMEQITVPEVRVIGANPTLDKDGKVDALSANFVPDI